MSQRAHPFSCLLFRPLPATCWDFSSPARLSQGCQKSRDTCRLGYLDSGLSLPSAVTLPFFRTLSFSRNDHAGNVLSGQGPAHKGASRRSARPWGESGRSGGAGGGVGGGASGGARQPGRSGRRSRGSESRSHVRDSAAEFLACGGSGQPGVRPDGEPWSGSRGPPGGRPGRRSAAPRCGDDPAGCEPGARCRSPPRRRGQRPPGTRHAGRRLWHLGARPPARGAGRAGAFLRGRGRAGAPPGARSLRAECGRGGIERSAPRRGTLSSSGWRLQPAG